MTRLKSFINPQIKKMKKLLFLSLIISAALSASSQTIKIKWKQIASGTNGQVAIVGTDGNGAWVTPPFPKWSDTTGYIATKNDISLQNGKEIVSAVFSGGSLVLTKQNGQQITIS